MNEKTTKRTARTTRPSTPKTPARAAMPAATPEAPLSASATPEPAPAAPERAAAAAAPKAGRPRTRKVATGTNEARPPASAKKSAGRQAAATAAKPAAPRKAVAAKSKKAGTPSPAAVPAAAAEAPQAGLPPVVAVQAPPRETGAGARSLSILIVASEAAPFSRTGGLGDLTGSLPAVLGALGHRVTLVVPRYAGESRGVPVDRFSVPLGGHAEDAACYEVPLGQNARAILVEHAGFFERDFLYGDGHADYADNPRRFAFLCRAALEFAARTGEAVDVVHAHDWQTALAPVFLRTEYAGADALRDAVAVLTIHDAGFQGICAPEWLGMLGMPRSLFTVDGLEFWGQVSLLKGGIVFADAVTTIGSTYAARLLAGERPSGLEGLLAARGTAVVGLIDDGAGRGTAEPDLDELARGAAGLFGRLREERGQPLRA